ncbi:helix-turn-helix domain-containing protein [Rhodococcus koreensis]
MTPRGPSRVATDSSSGARPIAHVTAELGISRSSASRRLNRYREFGLRNLLPQPGVHGPNVPETAKIRTTSPR